MASDSPAAARIAREHHDRSGERFERFTGGTRTPAKTSPDGSGNRGQVRKAPAWFPAPLARRSRPVSP